MVAVNPQIIKSYAQEDYDYMSKLVFRASRLAFFLLFIMALPIINNREYILSLWLGEYPAYTSTFVLLILIDSLINILSGPIQTAINATGRIKYYQIIVGGILLANLPIAYLLLKFGASVYVPFVASILLSLVAMVVRLLVFKRQTGISYGKFYTSVLPRTIAVVILSCIITQCCGFTNAITFSHLMLNVVITLIVVATAIFFVGLEKDERAWAVAKLNSIIKRK
jgi:O-antigen/teichoic acid export membrane protein